MKMKKGLIIGKGWIGEKLEKYLNSDFQLTTTKRISDADNCISVDFDQKDFTHLDINQFEFIVITIPFGKRNTTEELFFRFDNLIEFLGNYNKQIILISSTGIYPDSNQIVSESTYSDSELNTPYISIENKVKSQFPQTTILRLGGIMGDNRYLSKYLNLNREDLDEVVNHIHYQDILAVIKTCVERNLISSIYNVVAPLHPNKREVLEFQLNQNLIQSDIKKGKTISSEKLINELNYLFIFENPVYFKG